ncbi:leucine-rich repeat protein [Cellulomonas sp. CW35]|uniref:leucine-rich repeat protein n=1 Tax=Cellulomonas sp. CW35 TaxID=3458249 RepID=UPI004034612B
MLMIRALRTVAGLTAVALVASVLVLVPSPASPAAAVEASTGPTEVDDSRCADVLFVGVRGSGESRTEDGGYGPKMALVRAGFVAGLDASLTYRSIAIDYPALPIAPSDGFDGSLVDDLASYGIGIPPSPTRHYADSIQQGTFALLDAYAQSNRNCPDERIVLAGYSQGALVIHRVLSETTLGAKLAAVVLLADPARDTIHGNPASGTFFGNAGDSLGVWLQPLGGVIAVFAAVLGPLLAGTTAYFATRPAARGYDLWDTSAAASNPHMALSSSVAAKTIEMCAATDLVCDTQLGFGGDWYWAAIGTHTHYGTDQAVDGFRASDVSNLGVIAARRIPSSRWQYTVNAEGQATITGTSLVSTDLQIPQTVGGYPVVAIGDSALANHGLTGVVIPRGVITIGGSAFYGNALTSVRIPSGVKAIGEWAFGNNSLTSVDIADGVTTIGGAAFYGNDLTSVTIPSSVETIEGNGYYGAFARNALTHVVIPAGVRSVGDGAFASNALRDVVIPTTVTTLGDMAFSNNALVDVFVPGSVGEIGESAFEDNALTKAVIGDGVTAIGARAFHGNSLVDVVVPGSVMTIGSWAFGQNGLTSVTLRPGLATIGAGAFAINALTSVVLPDSVTNLGPSAFYGNSLTNVALPDGLATIGDTAFYGNALTDVTIPAGVTTIEGGAFAANQLAHVALPSTLETIGAGAFSSNRLTNMVIPDGVVTVGDGAFSSNMLTSVRIPEGITTIERLAFSNNRLTSVVIPGSVKAVGYGAFHSNELESVTITAGVTSIGISAFESNSLARVVIPASVRSVGGSAFFANPLTSVVMLGDAPSVVAAGESGWSDGGADALPYRSSFGDGAGLVITYPASATGYATPTWNGYEARPTSTLLPMESTVPVVAGVAVVGRQLTAKPGTWTSGSALKYQWFADGSAIAGATAATIALTSVQRDKEITVVVTGSKAGYTTTSETSQATGRVATATTPSISGSAAVGSKLSAKPGAWTSGMILAYQWYASGTPIAGATRSTFVLGSAQKAKSITVKVTGRRSGYPTVALTSKPTAKVATVGTPWISGTAKVGRELTARTGTWTSGTVFSFQWYANGRAISGATRPTWKLKPAQVGKRITVMVTGKKTGFATVSAKSAQTAPVSP